jgi:hypothetical protein
VQRFRRTMAMYDETRVDHFRGFAGYWSVDAQAETGALAGGAEFGVWVGDGGVRAAPCLCALQSRRGVGEVDVF